MKSLIGGIPLEMTVQHHRNALVHTSEAIRRGIVKVGFIGGSITQESGEHNWPESVLAWLVDRFPSVRFIVENAGIGATGSDLGVFRVERDIISRDCDLVFVEFAVNDGGFPSEFRGRTREGLLRKLLADGKRDVVLVYTYSQDMFDDMLAGEMPPSLSEFENLAEYYGLGSVWMGLQAFREVQSGFMRWEEWLPDGLHPQERGSYTYGQSVIGFLRRELEQKATSEPSDTNSAPSAPRALPAPVHVKHWGSVEVLPFDAVKLVGPWTLRRSTQLVWMDQVLQTSAIGAKLSFKFVGSGIALGFNFGRNSSEFRYRIDGGEFVTVQRDRPDWCGNDGWFRLELLTDSLPEDEHSVEVEVIHGNRPDCRGTQFKLGFIGIIRYEG